jgi:hypothetical protein
MEDALVVVFKNTVERVLLVRGSFRVALRQAVSRLDVFVSAVMLRTVITA